MTGKPLHVHFMGIMGSGAASIALVAAEQGYLVSGCDLSADSYYADELKKRGIRIEKGHSVSHLDSDPDIVAVSPALFDMSPDNEELLEAKRRGILMTWQTFMGEYLQQGKRVIAVAGTHGKTTTTFLTAEILIEGGLDPTVEGGSVYRKWQSGGRIGHSDLFLCEADEFNRNFFHYRPETAVLTNVEMDHPECYRDLEEVLEAFVHFLKQDPNLKTVVFSGDSEGAVEVIRRLKEDLTARSVECIAFFRDRVRETPGLPESLRRVLYSLEISDPECTFFSVTENGKTETFGLKIPGAYNAANAVAALLVSRRYGVSSEAVRKTLLSFDGAGRRFDLVGTLKDVPVYDDYAHHPTEIRSLLTMCRTYYPGKKILAVFEPHQISRLRLMFPEYVEALTIADHVVIAKTHIGREALKNVKPFSREEWQNASEKILYEEDPLLQKKIAETLIENGECDLILVIGAANSYKISRLFTEE